MSRIDVLRGGITGVRKTTAVCEAHSVRGELHMPGFGNLQVPGATSEDSAQFYERGLLAPGIDHDTPEPYLEELCDPLGQDGCGKEPPDSLSDKTPPTHACHKPKLARNRERCSVTPGRAVDGKASGRANSQGPRRSHP